MPSKVDDRNLVIARHGKCVYARRLLRPSNSEMVALAAETPDPRNSPLTLLFNESELDLHRVVGVLFGTVSNVPKSKEEAIQVDATSLVAKVRSAYRVKEDSAVPLVLPGQIALGGAILAPDGFDTHIDGYAALHLSDGTSVLKRIGDKLPSPLSHLRRFEAIGGLGIAEILAIGESQRGMQNVEQASLIVGVLYLT